MELGKYIFLRLISFLFQFVGSIFIIFFIFNIIPYDPLGVFVFFAQQSGATDVSGLILELQTAWGVNLPLHVQVYNFLSNLIISGDFGNSWYGSPVNPIIENNLPLTLLMLVFSILIYAPLSLILGIWSAKRIDTSIDTLFRLLTSILYGIPYYLYAVFFIFFLAPLFSGFGIISYFIPILVVITIIVIVFTSYQFRVVRSELNTVLIKNYIRTARSKGLSERKIIYKHALRNVLPRLVIALSVTIPLALSFIIVLEAIFGIPGLGPVIVGAAEFVDWGMIIGLSTAFILLNGIITMITDIVAKLIDPLDIKDMF